MKRFVELFIMVISVGCSWVSYIYLPDKLVLPILGVMLVVAYISMMIAPYILKRILRAGKLYSSPLEFKGQYYKCYSLRRFILTSGVPPQRHKVFFNANMAKDLPRHSVAFLIAHEYAHHRKNHKMKILVLMVLVYHVAIFGLPVMLRGLLDGMDGAAQGLMISLVVGFYLIIANIIISLIRINMEYRADELALDKIMPSRAEVLKALRYLSFNTDNRLFRTHPSTEKRMINLFGYSYLDLPKKGT